jgi:hypothetical protein
MTAQRKEADAAFGKFTSAVSKLNTTKYGEDFAKNLQESQAALRSLFDGRKGIDALSSSPPAAIALYTNTGEPTK